MRLKRLAFLLFFASSTTVWGQMGKLFNTDNQLSSNMATQVFQDRDGFIWVATRNGLNRYDGYSFDIIKKEDNDANLQSNYINSLTQDGDGVIYVGNNYTVQAYDGARFHDYHLTNVDGTPIGTYINYIMESRKGDILACTSGYGILRLKRPSSWAADSVLTGTVDTLLTGDDYYVRFMLEDSMDRFWIVTESGGLVFMAGGQRNVFFDSDDCRAQLTDVRQAYNGSIYAAVRGKGVYVYDEFQRSFRFLDKTASLPVITLCPCRDGRLLIGCDGRGIMLYDPETDTLTDNPFFSREQDLAKSKAFSILEDRNGNIWVALLQKGVFMQPKAKMDFGYMGYRLGDRNVIGTNCVTSTFIDSRGRVWVGTDRDGLYLVDKNDFRETRHFTNCPGTILTMAEDCKGRLWLGSWGEGCGWIDPQTGTWHPLDLGRGSSANVFGLAAEGPRQGGEESSHNSLSPLSHGRGVGGEAGAGAEAGAGHSVWIATMGGGLMRYNTDSGELKTYRVHDGADTDSTVNSLPNNYLTKICLSHDGKRLFVASSIGLSCYDIEHDSWLTTFGTNCPNRGTFSRDVYADRHDRVWLGTVDGLYCYHIKNGSFTKRLYTSADGLPADGIASIIGDLQGNLWIGTDRGLCCFNPRTATCVNYYVDNGLQGSEFSDGAVSISQRGYLLFGGTGGVTWFDPTELKPQSWKANVYLTEFILGQVPVTPGVKSGIYTVTDTTVINSATFDLSYDDNAFTIQLSTFTYDNPEHITYLYRINDDKWKRLQTGANEITFNGMAPGTYRFRVKAANNQQETDVREFTVRIHSPWYASVWAWVTYILVAVAAITLLLRLRQRKERDLLKLQEHIHAEQMADAKLRFFMNISHEIRTPMTLIVTPLLQLIKNDDDPQRRSVYETMRRNAERILGLINQMMDLRKIDKGQMQMRMCETDLVGFIDDIYAMFAHQAKTKNIRFAYEHDTDTLPVWIDRNHFDKVVVNLLSNAFKFTHPGGEVRISVTHGSTSAAITVYDDGESIPVEVIGHVFERFYQQPGMVNDRHVGTGIGLDLTRALVELHHGIIEVHNNADGRGCEFVVTIPLGNAHLSAEEMVSDTKAMESRVHTTSLEAEPIDDGAAASGSQTAPPIPKATSRQTLVVVEDDDELREALVAELSRDYDVTGCTNGLEGLKEVIASLPDLVISDIMMPEMDGNTLCSKIKANLLTSHIPVILLTAKNSDEDQLAGLETGADAYIVKPYNMDVLRRTIINLIRSHNMLRLKYGRNDKLEEKVDDVVVKTPDDKLLERVMNVINRNMANADLSVDILASEVGISRVHLHRKMKELTGQTPHDFIRNIRLKQAANLLSNQGMNVNEVMYACGFNNSATFSATFKRTYGLSPREYQKVKPSSRRPDQTRPD